MAVVTLLVSDVKQCFGFRKTAKRVENAEADHRTDFAMSKIRLAVVGGHEFEHYGRFAFFMDDFVQNHAMPKVISAATHPTAMAERWAKENGVEFRASDDDATHVLAFVASAPASRDTWDIIRKAQAKELPCIIHPI